MRSGLGTKRGEVVSGRHLEFSVPDVVFDFGRENRKDEGQLSQFDVWGVFGV